MESQAPRVGNRQPKKPCGAEHVARSIAGGYTSGMKIAVSIPDPLFKELKAAAKARGLTRGEFIRTALEDFLERRRNAELMAEIDRHIQKYGDPSDDEEAWLEQAQQTVRRAARETENSSIAKRKRKPHRQS